MTNQSTIDKLIEMRLTAMADAFRIQMDDPTMKEVPFEGGTLVWNYGEDRLQILFDRIPEDNRRKELKSSGFRWSPRNKAWQRQLTSNALSAAKRVLNLQNI
jgi:hypothetical protein